MKKLFLICLLITISCSKEEVETFESLNCPFTEINEPVNFGLIESEMVEFYNIDEEVQFHPSGYKFYEVGYSNGIELSRSYLLKPSNFNNDNWLYYAYQLNIRPENLECVKQWMIDEYGEPNQNTTNSSSQLARLRWDNPNTNENITEAIKIILDFAKQPNEDQSTYDPNQALWIELTYWGTSIQ